MSFVEFSKSESFSHISKLLSNHMVYGMAKMTDYQCIDRIMWFRAIYVYYARG